MYSNPCETDPWYVRRCQGVSGTASTGFSLIELLVVISIIALLLGIILPALGKSRDMARAVEVLSGGRQLMVGYSAYQADHDGHVPFGYIPNDPAKIDGVTPSVVEPVTGHQISGQSIARYPGRILPYVGSVWEILQLHQEQPLAKPAVGDSAGEVDSKVYALGVEPTFGLNTVYVGGDRDYGGFTHLGGTNHTPSYADRRIVYRQHQVREPSRLVTFCTAGSLISMGGTGEPSGGFHRVNSPKLAGMEIWAGEAKTVVPKFGASNFSVPWSHFAASPAAARFDGSVGRASASQLGDMTVWSNSAKGPDEDPFD